MLRRFFHTLVGCLLLLQGSRAAVPHLIGPVAYVQDLAISGFSAHWNEWPDVDPVAVPWGVHVSANASQKIRYIPAFGDPSLALFRILEIEADAGQVYFLDNQSGARAIGRQHLEFTGNTPLWPLTGQGMGTGRNLTLDGDWIVWADTSGIYRGRKDGTGTKQTIQTFAPAYSPASPGVELQAAGNIVWWLDRFAVAHIIRRKDLGTGQETALGPLPTSVSLAQRNGGYLYFLLNGRQIFRIAESLAGMPELVLDEAIPVSGFLPQGNVIYYGLTAPGGIGIKRLTIGTGAVDVLCSVGTIATKLASSGGSLFWHSVAEQRIYRLALANASLVSGDLSISDMEVTQGIQSLRPAEAMDLIREKETWVRVYPTAVSLMGADFVTTGAVLHGSGPGGPLPGSPLRPLRPTVQVSELLSPVTRLFLQETSTYRVSRDVLDSSFNFRLPRSWCQGTVTLTAEINPPGASGARTFPEAATANNQLARSATFSQQRPILNLSCPAVRISQSGVLSSSVFPDADMPRIMNRLLHFMPVSEVRVSPRPRLGPIYLWDTALQAARLAEDLHERYPLETFGWAGLASRQFYSVLPPLGVPLPGGGLIIGMAPYHSVASWNTVLLGPDSGNDPLISSPGVGVVMAHELTHNLGLGHPGCTPAESTFPAWLDPDYPYPVRQFGPTGNDRFHWLDIIGNVVVAPDEGADLMTYCRPLIPSDYLWRQTFLQITGARWVPGTGNINPGAFVQVSGSMSASGSFLGFRPSRVLQRSWMTPEILTEIWNSQLPNLDKNGRCRLLFLNATGAVVSDLAFNPSEAHPLLTEGALQPATTAFQSSFSFLVPEVPGTRKMQLYINNIFSGEQIVSNGSPVVNVITPTSGTTADAELNVQWTGSDPDGDDLHYSVQYSGDDGQTWSLLAHDIMETTTKCTELRLLPGGNAARVKVIATDGWNTGEAISPPFTVPLRAPTALILSPQPGQTFQTGHLIPFSGAGRDPDDVSIPGSSLFWRLVGSSRSGEGSQWEIADLPPGNYTAGLMVLDSSQQSHEALVSFAVSDRAQPLTAVPTIPNLHSTKKAGSPSLLLHWDEWATDFDLLTSPDMIQWLPPATQPMSGNGEWISEASLEQPRAFYKLERRP